MNKIWKWLKSLFMTRYKVVVSFDSEYGNNDDKVYITKKIITQTEKHLKFKDERGYLKEYRSSSGLNYTCLLYTSPSPRD